MTIKFVRSDNNYLNLVHEYMLVCMCRPAHCKETLYQGNTINSQEMETCLFTFCVPLNPMINLLVSKAIDSSCTKSQDSYMKIIASICISICVCLGVENHTIISLQVK